MSAVKIRAALETALSAMTPSMSIAFENAPFTPVSGTAFQRCNILFATPDNREMGNRYQQNGFMQVTLMYPLLTGSAAAIARAELIRTAFKRKSTFSNGGVTVLITDTPTIDPSTSISEAGGRFVVPVKINFVAQING